MDQSERNAINPPPLELSGDAASSPLIATTVELPPPRPKHPKPNIDICTSESYDFMNQSFGFDRGDKFIDSTVGVIDTCRKMDKQCDPSELTFLSDPSGLVNYRVAYASCKECREKVCEESMIGISAHGFFCSAIIGSRRIPDVHIADLPLGSLRGVSPPPRISLYAAGCPSCLNISDKDLCVGIQLAIADNVDVISMSVTYELPANSHDDTDKDLSILDGATFNAFQNDILVILPAGNSGHYHLRSISKAPPWCLTVASCSSRTKFKTLIEFGSELVEEYTSIEVSTINTHECDWTILRRKGGICGVQCVMYSSDEGFIIEAMLSSILIPKSAICFNINAKESAKISTWLDKVHEERVSLYVKVSCSIREPVPNAPLISDFSSRGPCAYYSEFMKPELCAPGEQIAAAWPKNIPVQGLGPEQHFGYNVLSGASFAVPHVAAAAAKLRAERKFPAPAIFSSLITTAVKMHGCDPIAREFACGAGMVDFTRVMQPGLVYEETPDNHLDCFWGDLPHPELNLPYFSATFPCGNEPWSIVFTRKLRNVEGGSPVYNGSVTIHNTSLDLPIESICIDIAPNTLSFQDSTVQEFALSVTIPHTRSLESSHGYSSFGLISASLVWKCEDEDLKVDCPIILSSTYVPPFHIVDQFYEDCGMYKK